MPTADFRIRWMLEDSLFRPHVCDWIIVDLIVKKQKSKLCKKFFSFLFVKVAIANFSLIVIWK